MRCKEWILRLPSFREEDGVLFREWFKVSRAISFGIGEDGL